MYATVEQADLYFTNNYGQTSPWLFLPPEDKQAFLTQATNAIDGKYGARFLGSILTNIQENLYPRTDFTDNHGRFVPAGTYPTVLVNATCEMALLASEDRDVYGANDRTGITSESKSVDNLSKSVSYSGSGSFTDSTGKVEIIISPILKAEQFGFTQFEIVRG